MPLLSIQGRFDGKHVLLDEDVDLPKDARVIVTVLGEVDQEREDFFRLSALALNAAYTDGEEVDYSEEDYVS